MTCLNRRVSIEGQPCGSLDRCLMLSKAPGSGEQQGNGGWGSDRGVGQDISRKPSPAPRRPLHLPGQQLLSPPMGPSAAPG